MVKVNKKCTFKLRQNLHLSLTLLKDRKLKHFDRTSEVRSLINDPTSGLKRLCAIAKSLRDPQHGCEWDLEQTTKSIATYAIEEAYEVAEAAENGRPEDLCDELGDLLFQIVLQAQLATEKNQFNINDVINIASDKMIRRHPNIFSENKYKKTANQQKLDWAEIKKSERMSLGKSQLSFDSVPVALPAMMRSCKIQSIASSWRFDFSNKEEVFNKLDEEVCEIKQAVEHECQSKMLLEVGDLLFTIVNLARFLDIDPEAALRSSNHSFEKRFSHMISSLRDSLSTFKNLTKKEKESLWRRAKDAVTN